MEEIFLGLTFPAEELHVVQEKHIDTTIPVPEFFCLFLLQGPHELVSVFLCPDIENLQVVFKGFMTDSVKQVGFTKSGPAVDKQRIVTGSGTLGDCQSGGKSKLVAGTRDKCVEGIPWVKKR